MTARTRPFALSSCSIVREAARLVSKLESSLHLVRKRWRACGVGNPAVSFSRRLRMRRWLGVMSSSECELRDRSDVSERGVDVGVRVREVDMVVGDGVGL